MLGERKIWVRETSKSDGTAIDVEVDVLGEGPIDVEANGGASEVTGLVIDVLIDSFKLAFS